jgi:hypothetical protein
VKKKLNIKIYFGIGNLFRYNTIFMELLDRNEIDEINVSICKKTLLNARNDYDLDTWFKEWGDVVKFIMTDDRIKYSVDQNFDLIGYYDLGRMYNINRMIKLHDNLVDNKPTDIILPKNYITISTKIWASIKKLEYEKIKNRIFEILNKYNGVILVTGERKISYCEEYRVIETYSIYEDLVNNLNNYQDFTIDETINILKIEPLRKSLYIINKSDLNIVMTFSGVREIALFMSKNVVALSPPISGDWSDVYVDISELKYNTENIHHTYNIDSFIKKLEDRITVENLKLNNE